MANYDIAFTAEGTRRVHAFSYILSYSRRQCVRFVGEVCFPDATLDRTFAASVRLDRPCAGSRGWEASKSTSWKRAPAHAGTPSNRISAAGIGRYAGTVRSNRAGRRNNQKKLGLITLAASSAASPVCSFLFRARSR
jgi:hypothetical protein